MKNMSRLADDDDDLHALRDSLIRMVRSNSRDLTCRQLGVLMISCTAPKPIPAYVLVERLDVTRPVITRVMDKLVGLGLARKYRNPEDGRSMLLVASTKGRLLIRRLTKT
jgi:DNA-binding MarR family transcriptional regulator